MKNLTTAEDGSEVVDTFEGEHPIEVSNLPASMNLTSDDVDIQVKTARAYPRSIAKSKQRALDLATLDEETAADCFYSLKRGGKPIEGPSVGLARIMAAAWGNMRIDARVIGENKAFVMAEGIAWDLESNVAIRVQVRRRITNSKGQRYNDDMIGVTANAACAIALRNAVFNAIPSPFTDAIYRRCREVAVGTTETLASRRGKMLQFFQKAGATVDQVYRLLGVAGEDDITLEHLSLMLGLASAIRSGDTTVDQAFAEDAVEPDVDKPEKPSAAAAVMTKLEAIRRSKAGKQPRTPPTPTDAAGEAHGPALANDETAPI